MTNEQRESVERLRKGIDDILFATLYSQEEMNTDIDTVLALIKEQQDKIAKYEKIYKEYDCYRWVKELDKKDKQIDLMAKFIENNMSEKKIINEICIKSKCNNEECHEDDLKDCIKQYFERKAEDEK